LIIFKVVRWKNLLSTGNTFTEVKLNESQATLIVGENGAGKSTFIEAISFALYGKPFRKINKPQLINSINNKNCLVEIEFSIGKKEYMVRRGLKPSVFEIIVDGQLLNQDAAVRDYQEILEKNILRLTHKSFSQIITLGSSTFIPFMQLPAQMRREFIEDLLDIQIFSTMNTLLKNRIIENKELLLNNASNIALCEQKIELGKSHLEQLRQNTEDIIKVKENIIQEQEDLVLQKTLEYDKVQYTLRHNMGVIDELMPKSQKHDAMVKLRKQIEAKLNKIEAEIKFYDENKSCPMCKQGIDHNFHSDIQDENRERKIETEKALAEIDEKIADLYKAVVEISDLRDGNYLLGQELSVHELDIRNIDTYIKNLKTEIEGLKTQQKKLDTNNQALIKANIELESLLSEKETLTNTRTLLSTAAMLLKDGGIKTKIIKQYVPIMNKLINKYLSAMDFFVQFEITESFEERLRSRFRDDFSYSSFSEGEKSRIDLALLFTWRSIAKLRNSASTNLLIFDETLDSSLDGNGIEDFMKMISNLTDNSNVFIISHRGDALVDKFDNVIQFKKIKNFSQRV
jgi:DNA repair exonuclease SbcCD ATPase subunit